MYYYRRNYVYDAALDAAGREPFVNDVVKVDYSTRKIQNLTLTLQRYMDLEETTADVYGLPADERPNDVTIREQIIVRNLAR